MHVGVYGRLFKIPVPQDLPCTLHWGNMVPTSGYLGPNRGYLEVHCTYNLLSNCSTNPIINPITTVTLDIIWL